MIPHVSGERLRRSSFGRGPLGGCLRLKSVSEGACGRHHRVVGVALRRTGVEGLHVGLVELGADAQTLDKVGVGQESAADTEQVGSAGVHGLLGGGEFRRARKAGIEYARAIPLLAYLLPEVGVRALEDV